MRDPVIEEVRKIRSQIEAQYADSEQYFAHLRELEKRHVHRLVCRKPQPALRATIAANPAGSSMA
jgi:hypothetical protein